MRVWRSSHAVNQWWIQLNERQRVLHMRQHKVPLYFTRGNKVVYGYTWKQIAAILRIVNKMKVIVDWIRLQTESVCCWWTVVFLWWDCIFRVSVLVAAMPSVMERSGAGVLSRSRAKTVTNGNSQPHSEEESSDEEHAHGRHTHIKLTNHPLTSSEFNSPLCRGRSVHFLSRFALLSWSLQNGSCSRHTERLASCSGCICCTAAVLLQSLVRRSPLSSPPSFLHPLPTLLHPHYPLPTYIFPSSLSPSPTDLLLILIF